MTFDNDHNGRLGPHEFKEAELMLAGKKEVAFFYADYPDEYLHDIKKYIENGKFESFQMAADNGLIVWTPGAKKKPLDWQSLSGMEDNTAMSNLLNAKLVKY